MVMQLLLSKVARTADDDWKPDFNGRNREALQANGDNNSISMVPFQGNDPSNGLCGGAKITL